MAVWAFWLWQVKEKSWVKQQNSVISAACFLLPLIYLMHLSLILPQETVDTGNINLSRQGVNARGLSGLIVII